MTRLPTEVVALTPEQEEIISLCRSFAASTLRPAARAVDEADTEMDWETWGAASRAGLTSFMLPERFGGGGATDIFTQCLVQEELCAGDLALGNLITSNGFFAHPLLELGSEDQLERYLRPLASDTPPLTALAVTEPDVGSDAAAVATRAERIDGGYRLSGRKAWISNGGVAEFYLVFATVDPALRARGVTAFLLKKSTPGLSFGPPLRKMGQRALLNTEIFLDGVEVPVEDRLGEEGDGFIGLMHTFDASRVILGASATGVARAALDYAVEYANERHQFGVPISRHQAVAFRIADMAARVEAARLMVWRAARRLDSGERATAEAAMAKLTASETAVFNTWAAVQTLGGWGYSRDHLVEKWMRDAKLEEIEEGTSDIQRLVIARSVLGRSS